MMGSVCIVDRDEQCMGGCKGCPRAEQESDEDD